MCGNIIFYTTTVIDPPPVHLCSIDIMYYYVSTYAHTYVCACLFVSARECLQERVRACVCVHKCVTVEPLLYDHPQNHIGVVV